MGGPLPQTAEGVDKPCWQPAALRHTSTWLYGEACRAGRLALRGEEQVDKSPSAVEAEAVAAGNSDCWPCSLTEQSG